jgi:hypothetical protein
MTGPLRRHAITSALVVQRSWADGNEDLIALDAFIESMPLSARAWLQFSVAYSRHGLVAMSAGHEA